MRTTPMILEKLDELISFHQAKFELAEKLHMTAPTDFSRAMCDQERLVHYRVVQEFMRLQSWIEGDKW